MNKFMSQALAEAKKAYAEGEVPVGAVIVFDNKIIARGRNCREKKQNALCHAEIIAIDKACKKKKSWRLDDCEMYVTLEPCPMCAGAIVNARLKKVVFGAQDLTSGFAISNGQILSGGVLNHKVEIEGGVMAQECKEIVQDFFKEKRQNKRKITL